MMCREISMIDDEQQQALNLFDVIQGDYYNETIYKILVL